MNYEFDYVYRYVTIHNLLYVNLWATFDEHKKYVQKSVINVTAWKSRPTYTYNMLKWVPDNAP